VSEPRTSVGNTQIEKGPLEHDDAIQESTSSNISPNYASHKKPEAPIEKNAKEQHVQIPKPVPFLRRIYELRKAFQAYQLLSTADETAITCDIGLDDFEILLWFQSEQSARSAWSEPSVHKVSYSRFLRRPGQMQPRSDSFLRQVCVLREAFRHNSSPSISEIEQIGCEIGLEDFEVSFWFETEKSIQLECLTECMAFQQDPESPQFSHSSMYSRSSLTGTSLVSDNVKLNHQNHPEPGLAGNLHKDLAQWEAPSLAGRCNKRQRPVHTPSNATSASIVSPPDKRLRRTKVQGSFPCLFESCDSIAADVLKWRDHQLRTHFPKRVWICWLKKDDESECKHGPVTRSDNFVTHLINEHHQSRGPELQQLVQSKGLNVRNLYHEECGFCTRKLKSWEDSMKHISEHLSRGSTAESWEHCCSSDHDLVSHIEYQSGDRTPSDHNEKPEDEDERDDGTDPNGSRGADSTFEDRNQGPQDPERQNEESKESEDHAGWRAGASPTQKDAEDNDMHIDFQGLASNTATISVQANKVDMDYVSLEVLGHGGFSFVDKIVHRASKKIYARKTTFYRKSPSRESVEVQFQNEVDILKTLQHPHLITFIDAYTLQDRLSIIMSPVADESLTSFMSRFNKFPPALQKSNKSSLWRWISCLASALAYLHGHLIRHQDIKPSNILVKGDQVLLTDFGNAKKFLDKDQVQIRDFKNKLTVTPMYCPPEAMRSGLQGFTADVFSLGCVYAEIITLCLDQTLADFELFRSPNPYDGAFRNQLEKTVEWIESLQEDYRQAALKHTAPSSVSLEMICCMLDQDPEQRPTARQVQYQLLPCTCCSTVVTTIETAEDVTPLYPSTVESVLGEDEKSNVLQQTQTTKPEIALISEVEEPPLQQAEENHAPQASIVLKDEMRIILRPAHVSDRGSDTDAKQILSRRQSIGKRNSMLSSSKTSRNTPCVTAKDPSEESGPRMNWKPPMRSGRYNDEAVHDRKKDKDDRRVFLSNDSSGGSQAGSSPESDGYDSAIIPSSRASAISSLGNDQLGAVRGGDMITGQHTRVDFSTDESRVCRLPQGSRCQRHYLPRTEGDTARFPEDSLAYTFTTGYATDASRFSDGRERIPPTPPLTTTSSSRGSSGRIRPIESRSPRYSLGSQLSIEKKLRDDITLQDLIFTVVGL
jgi:serine/threonine protein kinase